MEIKLQYDHESKVFSMLWHAHNIDFIMWMSSTCYRKKEVYLVLYTWRLCYVSATNYYKDPIQNIMKITGKVILVYMCQKKIFMLVKVILFLTIPSKQGQEVFLLRSLNCVRLVHNGNRNSVLTFTRLFKLK